MALSCCRTIPSGRVSGCSIADPAKPGNSLATRATGEHGEASLQPMLIGETFTKYEIWDAMRGVDYLSRLPEVDAHRIGALGCSGGGAVTAMTSALDTRIAAIGVACFTTSFDTLLPAVGAQEGEQSIPEFVSSGFDFPDWIELAAPRPYAVIATYADMFPFAGARTTVIEARRFYSIFDRASAGTAVGSGPPTVPPTPTGPALNADTTNQIPLNARLQFITGPGRHGALQPIMGRIISFFMRNLEPGADADHPLLPKDYLALNPGSPPAALSSTALQVTPSGQVSTSFPNCATVFSLNLKRASEIVPAHYPALSGAALAQAVREVTGAKATPGASKFGAELLSAHAGAIVFPASDGETLEGEISVPANGGRHPTVLFLVPDSIDKDNAIARANKARFDALAAAGNVVLAITPRPSPPGTDDMKSPLLGPFYLLSLRADIVGRTLVGLRVDDAIQATDYLAARPDVDRLRISAVGSGHMGLVLLHAAALDGRLRHVEVDHLLSSYRSLLDAPLPIGAPEDILPGVLLHYDLPELARALGTRLKASDALNGKDDLSQTSTPLKSLTEAQP